ncbi:Crp/Fnr family transcriptional regulator [Mesorhizobium denitrificans]|uniref:Crp/Fnr family transcriptional regulator n=1 Tax=Mesorhizobium denitrificans TaxID=2294114 RepID=A0A371X224_9HYPH|nr:Crp/Fnr family transcriptional regulator [Mesorhizobium denitrificans]RFC63257.1 Crp/Fnr family transcriptional regulator [Mesorhizobium denitrificans]
MSQALIRKLQNFVKLSATDQRALERAGSERVRRIGPHEDIIREGDKPSSVMLIVDGWACRYKYLEDGRRQIVGFFVPGDICDLNIFLLKEMDHSIGSLTEVLIADISRESLETLMGVSQRIAQALWWDSLVSLAIQREWTINLGQRDAVERMSHLFCEMFLRQQSAGRAQISGCEFPVTQAELGDATGLSTVHVNRTLQQMRSAEMITLHNKRLVIHDLDALMRQAMFNPNYLHLGRDGAHLDAND